MDQNVRNLLAWLERVGQIDDRLLHHHFLPPRSGRTAPWPNWVNHKVKATLQELGVQLPWEHQAQAADLIHSGYDTVISTGTGSGKSLSAWLPILSNICDHEARGATGLRQGRPTALYLSPTKALAADQAASLNKLIGLGKLPVRVGQADGDVSAEAKAWARGRADIVTTNPDFLHYSLLPGHQGWNRLLSNLELIILDEMHHYRGVFGAHVALVLRRLLRISGRLGARPTVAMLSATVRDPHELAHQFLGQTRTIRAITEDTSPSGERHLIMWQPRRVTDENSDFAVGQNTPCDDGENMLPLADIRRSALVEAASLAVEIMRRDLRLLAFSKSRAGAEALAAMVRETLSRTDPGRKDKIASYRGGYLPEERRSLEQALQSGNLQGLATTSALELGLDVSGLEATITAGWPGSRASLWQQAGRAGRAGAAGVCILIASDNPLDAYLVNHPEEIFSDVERTVFDTLNPHILAPHLAAAAYESPLTEVDLKLFDLGDERFIETLGARGLLRRRPAGWYWNTSLASRPHDLADLRGGGGTISIVEEHCGAVIGEVDQGRANGTVHPGAIYVHQGKCFEVTDLSKDVALVRKALPSFRTRAGDTTSVRIVEVLKEVKAGPIQWCFGEVEVTSQVTSYDLLRLPGLQFVKTMPLDLPPKILPTRAMWWTCAAETLCDFGVAAPQLPGALHAAEHSAIGLLPLLAQCDRWDIGGLSTARHEQTLQPTVFIHDGLAGGTGFAQTGFDSGPRWVEATLQTVSKCSCNSGCPRCIQSPKCGNNNEPLDKDGAIKVLTLLNQALQIT